MTQGVTIMDFRLPLFPHTAAPLNLPPLTMARLDRLAHSDYVYLAAGKNGNTMPATTVVALRKTWHCIKAREPMCCSVTAMWIG